jgi:hypothetical protein
LGRHHFLQISRPPVANSSILPSLLKQATTQRNMFTQPPLAPTDYSWPDGLVV